MKKKYYISSAIAYASAVPHIGNTYDVVLADAIARYKREKGFDVYFQTGTDEHGEKIEIKSKTAGQTPEEYTKEISGEVKNICDLMNVSYTSFVRTTDPIHKKKVQEIFKKLYDQGDIYKAKYEGVYCVPCESFYTESQLIDGKCPDCGRVVEKRSEEAYFFKLKEYAGKLEQYYDENPKFILPEFRKVEIVNNFIKPGLQDLCVSRTSVKWGIPIEFDPGHTVYVWIDALSNYITFLGYDVKGENAEEYNKYWPCDLHIIGKDIMRFHILYWPAILMALGEKQPIQIFGHPWIKFGEEKMSKSKGNVIYAADLVDEYGVDAVRYYILHEIPYGTDGLLTEELLEERINSDLANILGNLVNRTMAMINKYFEGMVLEPNKEELEDKEFKRKILETVEEVDKKMGDLHVAEALNDVINVYRMSNKYIDETTPWILGKNNEKERLATVLYNLIEAIRIGSVLLKPFLPETAADIFEQINTNNVNFESINSFGGYKVGTKLNEPHVLFQRIEKRTE